MNLNLVLQNEWHFFYFFAGQTRDCQGIWAGERNQQHIAVI